VYFVTRDRRITYWNGGAERITGYGAAEMLGHGCSEGTLRHVNDAGRQLCLHGCPLAGVMKDGKPRVSYVYLHHKDGHRVPVTVRGQALFDPDGTIVGSVEVFSARVDNPYAEQRRVHLDDSLDPVTGLPPRRLGELHLETLARAVGDQAATLGVLFIDVDHFKLFNDQYGHQVGDIVLRSIANAIQLSVREEDVPVRYGGEEFLVLLRNPTPGIALEIGERIRANVRELDLSEHGVTDRLTVSIGVATGHYAGETIPEIVERADRALYAAKRTGRDRVVEAWTSDVAQ